MLWTRFFKTFVSGVSSAFAKQWFLTRAFNLATRAFNLATRGFELITREFELVTRGFELVTREFELFARGLELVTRVLLFHFFCAIWKRKQTPEQHQHRAYERTKSKQKQYQARHIQIDHTLYCSIYPTNNVIASLNDEFTVWRHSQKEDFLSIIY